MKNKSITETSNFISAASVWVAERIGLKKAVYRKKNEPTWEDKTERDIKRLRQEVDFLKGEPRGGTGIEEKIQIE